MIMISGILQFMVASHMYMIKIKRFGGHLAQIFFPYNVHFTHISRKPEKKTRQRSIDYKL